ncbi:uncharacterized protein TNCV_3410211 [Trichonephila clavipes]|nr:uncharacterized protein TNCV_3410211 [Trichonephila clavipes]
MAPFTWAKIAGNMPDRIRFVPVYTATRDFADSKCRSRFRTLFRLGRQRVSTYYMTVPTMSSRIGSTQVAFQVTKRLTNRVRRAWKEDFGKRNMPGKRARRHFSQLSEFEIGLIIGMKTSGWSTWRVAGHVDRSECVVRNCWEQWTREGTHARKTGSGVTRKTTKREYRKIVRQALVDPN